MPSEGEQASQASSQATDFLCEDPVLEHVVANILGQGSTSDAPLRKAFRSDGIDAIPDLLSMTLADVDALSYWEPDDDGKYHEVALNRGTARRVQLFLDFLQWRAMENDPVTDILNLSRLAYDEFCTRTDLSSIRHALNA